MIPRFLQQSVEKALRRSPSIAILGPRQVGKTTLAKTIGKNQPDCRYLDLENPRDRLKLYDGFSYLSSLQKACVIVDEVQLIPELFSILRPIIDANSTPGRFILLGSASPSLVKGISESLAGRIAYMELTVIGLTELPADQGYKKHWFRGGFPNALLARNEEECKEWLNDFIRSYIERDLGHLFGVDLSPVILRNFWTMLAHSNGNIWNAEVFARSLGVSAPTVLRYLSFLEGGYLIRRLPPWFVNSKKRLVKSPKIYIRDSGINHRLLQIPDYDSLLGHPGVGGSWEGYVIEQIYQRKSTDIELYFYRTQAGAECDLVLVKGITPIACIEIKLNNSPAVSKGFISSMEDLQPRYKYIITPESDSFTTQHDIRITNLYHFITDFMEDIK
ncbi:MAG TPA: ATP-binding protein [Chitinophagaceae bacterium]|nr:ATP-binding protein [Chitinophagaceae bacterium]